MEIAIHWWNVSLPSKYAPNLIAHNGTWYRKREPPGSRTLMDSSTTLSSHLLYSSPGMRSRFFFRSYLLPRLKGGSRKTTRAQSGGRFLRNSMAPPRTIFPLTDLAFVVYIGSLAIRVIGYRWFPLSLELAALCQRTPRVSLLGRAKIITNDEDVPYVLC